MKTFQFLNEGPDLKLATQPAQNDDLKRKAQVLADQSDRKVNPKASTPTSRKIITIDGYFDTTLGDKIRVMRNQLSYLSRRKVAQVGLEAQPCITLLSFDGGHPYATMSKVKETLRDKSKNLLPMHIVMSTLSTSSWIFGPGPSSRTNDQSDLFISPTPSFRLVQYHKTLYDELNKQMIFTDADYRPNSWVPKCFLVRQVGPSRMSEGFNRAYHEFQFPVSGEIVRIEMVEVDTETGVKQNILSIVPDPERPEA